MDFFFVGTGSYTSIDKSVVIWAKVILDMLDWVLYRNLPVTLSVKYKASLRPPGLLNYVIHILAQISVFEPMVDIFELLWKSWLLGYYY